MKRMLINATQQEELRVALVDGQKLYDLDIETPSREQKKANVYKGRITRIEPSLEAVFVDYGSERHGFLPFKEIARGYLDPELAGDSGRPNVKDAIKEGQEVVVQIDKEERGNKGAALTTFVSLAGRYLVLMPNNPRAGGVSRRIEGDERQELRDIMRSLDIPNGMGMIVRTAGVGRSVEELQWDLNYLQHVWESIQNAVEQREAPFLVYQESNIIIRALRDYMRPDIGEILIDNPKTYQYARDFMEQVIPHNLSKLKLYQDATPLFTRFQIESQIETAYMREVALPSGGAVVIDYAEALISIDINSARATKGSDIEETALTTNLEAADEVARQLRLRDLGGLVVIDFIDMNSTRNQREVENRVRELLKLDRARIQVSRISRFGLMEMSRQRLRPSLDQASHVVCPRCNGQGSIRGVQSLALSLLRLIEEEAIKEKTGRVMAQVPVKVATFLLNEKRASIETIEQRHNMRVLIIPNESLETPHFELLRLRNDELNDSESARPSYEMVVHVEDQDETNSDEQLKNIAEEPAVKTIAPTTPAPPHTIAPQQLASAPQTTTKPGFFKWLSTTLFGAAKEEPEVVEEKPPPRRRRNNATSASAPRKRRGGRNNNRRGDGRDDGRNDRSDSRDDNRGNSRSDSRNDRNDNRGDSRSDSRSDRNDSRGDSRSDSRSDRNDSRGDSRNGGRNRGGSRNNARATSADTAATTSTDRPSARSSNQSESNDSAITAEAAIQENATVNSPRIKEAEGQVREAEATQTNDPPPTKFEAPETTSEDNLGRNNRRGRRGGRRRRRPENDNTSETVGGVDTVAENAVNHTVTDDADRQPEAVSERDAQQQAPTSVTPSEKPREAIPEPQQEAKTHTAKRSETSVTVAPGKRRIIRSGRPRRSAAAQVAEPKPQETTSAPTLNTSVETVAVAAAAVATTAAIDTTQSSEDIANAEDKVQTLEAPAPEPMVAPPLEEEKTPVVAMAEASLTAEVSDVAAEAADSITTESDQAVEFVEPITDNQDQTEPESIIVTDPIVQEEIADTLQDNTVPPPIPESVEETAQTLEEMPAMEETPESIVDTSVADTSVADTSVDESSEQRHIG